MNKPIFSQSNFLKICNEFDALDKFIRAYSKMPTWKHILFGRSILREYLSKSNPKKPVKSSQLHKHNSSNHV